MKRILLSSAVAMTLAVASVAGAQAPAQPAWMSTPVKEMLEKAQAATVQVPLAEFKADLTPRGTS